MGNYVFNFQAVTKPPPWGLKELSQGSAEITKPQHKGFFGDSAAVSSRSCKSIKIPVRWLPHCSTPVQPRGLAITELTVEGRLIKLLLASSNPAPNTWISAGDFLLTLLALSSPGSGRPQKLFLLAAARDFDVGILSCLLGRPHDLGSSSPWRSGCLPAASCWFSQYFGNQCWFYWAVQSPTCAVLPGNVGNCWGHGVSCFLSWPAHHSWTDECVPRTAGVMLLWTFPHIYIVSKFVSFLQCFSKKWLLWLSVFAWENPSFVWCFHLSQSRYLQPRARVWNPALSWICFLCIFTTHLVNVLMWCRIITSVTG